MKNASHPIWFIVRFVCLLTFLGVFLWLNDGKFSEAEEKIISGVMLMAYGAGEWAINKRGK